VDVDLEKFFDRVNHDILIDRLQKRIGDVGVIQLIRSYLNSGIMVNGVVQEREKGTPQGGPLSPLLANVLLDEVDKELERRGHCFVRYADDANVYVRSRRAGQRVMVLLLGLYGKLRLTVNEAKSAVASVFQRKFLGYSLWGAAGGKIKRRVADKATAAFKQRIRADSPLRRAQPRRGGQATACLYVGMESLFPDGRYSKGLARTGQMDTAPGTGDPTETMEARRNGLPQTAWTGSVIRCSGTSSGQHPSLVAQQRKDTQHGAGYEMGQSTRNP